MSNRPSFVAKRVPILDRSINKNRGNEINVAAFAFLFSEMLQYAQKRANGIQDLEKRLSDFGYRVGIRVLELQVARDKPNRRENRVLGILYFIHSNVWKSLFGKQADSLEKGTENDDEYMISDNEPQISKFISIPKELSVLNAAAFIAGIVEAVLDGSQFPARVSAHSTGTDQFPLRTTLLIKFDKSGM
ncbi:NO signaling/Golgi transport ligand-binding domain-containing protein [Cladochytrium replicatum]|nr:NO signaling/Golgi transport ligand-binding domain-containing protein [Cladochytrium replicatum]